MTHEAAFLAAIVIEPDADVHRLVMADWLDENGRAERADFIRVQCALARPEMRVCACFSSRWPGQTYVCQRCVLRSRERELLSAHYREWLPPPVFRVQLGAERLAWEVLSGAPPVAVFRRGFVAEVALPCREWLEHGPALVRAAPLEKVGLSDREPHRTHVENDGREVWCWWRPDDAPTLHALSDELWRALVPPDGCYPLRWDHISVWSGDTEAAAREALSDAALAWARGVPLPDPPPAR